MMSITYGRQSLDPSICPRDGNQNDRCLGSALGTPVFSKLNNLRFSQQLRPGLVVSAHPILSALLSMLTIRIHVSFLTGLHPGETCSAERCKEEGLQRAHGGVKVLFITWGSWAILGGRESLGWKDPGESQGQDLELTGGCSRAPVYGGRES